jgi:hypothetical protein
MIVTVVAPSEALGSAVLGFEVLGASFVGMAAAGAALCASVGATIKAHRTPPRAAAKVHLVTIFSRPALRTASACPRDDDATMAK